MLWAASAYSCGIVTGVYVWRPALWWLVGAVAFCASGTYFLRRRSYAAFALALSALFVTGALMMQVRVPANAGGADVLSFADGREVIVTGHVVKEGNLREKNSGDAQQRLDLETEQITTRTDTGSRSFAIHSGLRVTVYGHELGKEEGRTERRIHFRRTPFRYGERLRFPAKLLPPHNFRNPGAFDYTGYLAQDGIVALGSTKAEAVELLPGFAGNRFELWRTRVRRNLIERIHALWKPDDAALIDAMLIGENSFLGRETLTDFQRTGTYHVLVISGLKVAVLALVMFWLLRRLRVSDIAASAIDHSADGRLCPADRRWRSGVAGHADACAVPRREVALPAEINSQHHRRSSAGSADCRSSGAARSQLPTQLPVRARYRRRRRSIARADDATLVSRTEEFGRDELRRGVGTATGAIPA